MRTYKTGPTCNQNILPHTYPPRTWFAQYKATIFITSTLLIMLLATDAFSWSNHAVVTKLAIEKHPFIIKQLPVTVTSLESALKKIGGERYTKEIWLGELNLSPKAPFDFKTHFIIGKNRNLPGPGSKTSALAILSDYTDEPDWGMDQNVYISKHQENIGGFQGPESQALRHLYLEAWNPLKPLSTLHYPLTALGEAHRRAAMFSDWSILAFTSGERYWGFRFLAWALHYIEDLGQPFHSCVLPHRDLIALEKIDGGIKAVIKSSARRTVNYHYLYEFWVENKLLNSASNPFKKALRGTSELSEETPAAIAVGLAKQSNSLAFSTADSTIKFFGREYLDSEVDIPNATAKYRKILKDRSKSNRKAEEEMQEVTLEALRLTGEATRGALTWMKNQLENQR